MRPQHGRSSTRSPSSSSDPHPVSARSPLAVGLALVGASSAILVLAARLPPLLWLLPRCAFLTLTGLPCPTCGVCRALVALADGRPGAALAQHPLATLAAVASLVLAPWSAAHLLWPATVPFPRPALDRHILAARAFAVALVLNWAYLLATSLAR